LVVPLHVPAVVSLAHVVCAGDVLLRTVSLLGAPSDTVLSVFEPELSPLADAVTVQVPAEPVMLSVRFGVWLLPELITACAVFVVPPLTAKLQTLVLSTVNVTVVSDVTGAVTPAESVEVALI
jgi:hypothetical protein